MVQRRAVPARGDSAVASDAFAAVPVPGALELLERGEVDDHDIPVDDVVAAGGTRGLGLGLSAADVRLRWQVLVNRLRGYRQDRVLVDRQPFWLPLLELDVPPGGKATLRYEHQAGQEKGAALKILGMGFGSSESISISRSVELGAEASGKSFEWKMHATATRYVDTGGGPPLTRVDITSPEGGAEYRVRDLPPVGRVAGDEDGWRVVNRMDLSSSTDTGRSTWTYRITRRGSWTAGIGVAPLQALGIDVLQVESDRSEQFEAAFELPYGEDYLFYCRAGEWPVTPRCALVAKAPVPS